ncbi:MAG: EAL domain-containing protein [Alkalicoccus sp.]|nr:MAG: EAL domain-containing protein [Alkalicoccus sp.]
MQDTLMVLEASYDWRLILLSIAIACTGAFVAFEINRRLTKLTEKKQIYKWIFIGSIVLASSIWSMHFIGMSAYQLHIPMDYDSRWTVVSFFAAFAASFTAFFVLHQKQSSISALLSAGLITGAGIAAMHYTGMQAVSFAGQVTYSAESVIGASAIAVVGSFAAFALFTYMKISRPLLQRVGASLFLGLAVSSMHYTGMEGTSFCIPETYSLFLTPDPVVNQTSLLTATITGTAVIFISVQWILFQEKRWFHETHYKDAITGLHNQRFWMKQVPSWNEEFKVIIYADIMRLRALNQSYGFTSGDAVLKQAAEMLQNRISPESFVFKSEGSKFLLCLKDADNFTADEQLSALQLPYEANVFQDSQRIHLSLCFGGTAVESSTPPERLAAQAEIALAHAKQQERTLFFYEEKNHQDLSDEWMEMSLRKALQNKEMAVYYQPQARAYSGEVNKVEALIRWQHPDYGMISPGVFIDAAERFGLIMPLTIQVVEKVCLQLKEWQKAAAPIQRVSINLSPLHFEFVDANRQITEVVHRHGIPPEMIEWELTETSMVENLQQMAGQLLELEREGFYIALDDFGAGVSSLTRLQDLPIHTLKLDKQFMNGFPGSDKKQQVIQLMITFAELSRMEIVCEGVETKEQLASLQKMNAGFIQGYIFQQPVPASELVFSFAPLTNSEGNAISDQEK